VDQETTVSRSGCALAPVESTDARHDERELVRAVLQRDRKATAEFVARYADPVYSYIRRRLFPRADLVDDLVQDVFVSALESLGTYAGASSLRTWLLGIARHKVEDHYRDCLKQPLPLSEVEAQIEVPGQAHVEYDELLDREKRDARIQQVLASVPDAYRAVLLWRYWEKRSAREMAARCGRTEKAVEWLLARARHEFRRRWHEG
jgi:RNA polymerase sigma-70 factor (ECF subfamily)